MGYRSVNFRDGVLWTLARLLGLDPDTRYYTVGMMIDQANSLASYINIWVRKKWDEKDYPEWTVIQSFSPDPVTHIVPYSFSGGSFGPGMPPVPTPSSVFISRVFKVYLCDPEFTQGAFDTPFTLRSEGIHCGFEHGPTVWVRFIANPPQFSADQWLNTTTYALNQLVYSNVTGETYISLIASNLGNDPSTTPPTIPPPIGQPWALVPFPFALVDAVLRGAYADALKEWGQSEKSEAMEKAASEDAGSRAGVFAAPPTDRLTDQTFGKNRYTMPP